jgi:hypothetical protein
MLRTVVLSPLLEDITCFTQGEKLQVLNQTRFRFRRLRIIEEDYPSSMILTPLSESYHISYLIAST